MNIERQFKILLSELAQYRFAVSRIELLINEDLKQLKNGGDFLNLSILQIRDWSNHSDTEWFVDTRRMSFYSKGEYIKDIEDFKAVLYKHYLIEIYERLFHFVASVYQIPCDRPKIYDVTKVIDKKLHNTLTPFEFTPITFLICFNKIRNSFTHSQSVLNRNEFDQKEYLNGFLTDRQSCETFSRKYFNAILINDNEFQLSATAGIVYKIIEFTQSYAFENYKHLCIQEDERWLFGDQRERLDIKTELPLTIDQKEFLKKSLQNEN